MEEAAGSEIILQGHDFFLGEIDVAVTGHVQVRMLEQVGIGDLDALVTRCSPDIRALADLREQVGQGRGIRIPVAAAAVLEPSDGEIILTDEQT
jgi:hypothetical protein